MFLLGRCVGFSTLLRDLQDSSLWPEFQLLQRDDGEYSLVD
jgi:hypothetical protein